MMQRHHRTTRRQTRGFSITELLVVIGIMALLVAIVFPVISVMTSSSRIEAGLNIVGMSSDVARQWVQAEAWANDASAIQPIREEYSGTAALFCPTGEIRIVINDRMAQDGSVYLEDQRPAQNGYKDLDQVEYILMPNGVGVAGIQRTGAADDAIRYIAPPFAIAYNEDGQLNYGDANGYIYYDADADTPPRYERSSTRASVSNYDPFDWRGFDDAQNADPMTPSLRKELPFEAIECVPGVVIYNKDDFKEAGFDFSGGGEITPADTDAWEWLQENGETVFFSPHTGVMLRDEEKE
jgi:prepilin-type N-terminal cleavage/methylation domain-containing protein